MTAWDAYGIVSRSTRAQLLDRLPDDDRKAIDEFDRQVTGVVSRLHQKSEELRATGRLTPEGIRNELRKDVTSLITQIDRFAQATATNRKSLEEARGRIERGELVRGSDGTFYQPTRPVATAASTAREAEIRAYARGLSEADRRTLALRAFESGDDEVLHALENSPKLLAVIDEPTRELLAAARVERAGFEPQWQAGVDAIVTREQFETHARAVVSELA